MAVGIAVILKVRVLEVCSLRHWSGLHRRLEFAGTKAISEGLERRGRISDGQHHDGERQSASVGLSNDWVATVANSLKFMYANTRRKRTERRSKVVVTQVWALRSFMPEHGVSAGAACRARADTEHRRTLRPGQRLVQRHASSPT